MTSHSALSPTTETGRSSQSADEELFASLYVGLRRFAAVVGSSDMDPDDLVQDAVTRALAGGPLARFAEPGAYLRRAILNTASNARRSAGRQRRALLRLRGGQAETRREPYPSDLSELAGLSPRDRAIVYLHEIEDLGYDEIGALLGVNAGSARMAASRALRALRSKYVNKPEEETR